MKKNKKSQVQMGETIAVLFIFMLLMGFGSLFFLRIMKSTSNVKQEDILQLRAIETAQKAAYLPEIECSEAMIVEQNCVDILKAESAAVIINQSKAFYYDKFGFSNITVIEVYPYENSYGIYENIPEKFSSIKTSFIPVTIFEPLTNRFHTGYIKVEAYS